MEMVGPYDEDEDIEEMEEEGQDQEVPQVPSPPEETGEVVSVNRLEEVIGNRLETEVEMVNILEERQEDGNIEDEAESSVSETIQSDEADPITVSNFNDTTDLLEEEAV